MLDGELSTSDYLDVQARRLHREGVGVEHLQNWALMKWARGTQSVEPNSRAGQWYAKLDLLKQRLGTGFLICVFGKRGTGKTQFAPFLMQAAHDKDGSARYCTAFGINISVRSTYSRLSPLSEEEVIKYYCSWDLLIIDEMKPSTGSQHEDAVIQHIVDERYRHGRDTLLLTNLAREAFFETYGPSIADRITQKGGMMHLDWDSFREPGS